MNNSLSNSRTKIQNIVRVFVTFLGRAAYRPDGRANKLLLMMPYTIQKISSPLFNTKIIMLLLALYLVPPLSNVGLYAQNAPLGCDKYTLLLAEYTSNFNSSTTMAIPFLNSPGQMPTGVCDLGANSGNDGIAVNPAKNVAYIVSGTDIKVYDFAQGKFIATYPAPAGVGAIFDVVLSLDKQSLYLSTRDGGLIQMNVTTGAIIASRPLIDFTSTGGLWGVAVNPSTGNVYVTSGFQGPNGLNTIQSLPSNLAGTPTIIYTAPQTIGDLTGITFAADGTLWGVFKSDFPATPSDYLIHLTATGTVLGQYTMPPPTATSGTGNYNVPFDLAFGPDGNLYIATFYGPCVLKFDVSTNTYSTYIPNVPNSSSKGLAFVCGNFKCPCANDLSIGTINSTSGNCVNGIIGNNGTATINGIGVGTTLSSSMKIDINEGSSYGTLPMFGAASNKSVSSGSATFSNLKPGITYTVRIWNGSDGCYLDKSFITPALIIPAPPTAIIPTGGQPTCTLATGTITVTNPSGVTYSFDNSATFQANNTKSGLAPGTYQITIKDANGCYSPAVPVIINPQPATPTPTVNSPTICAGVSATLTVSNCAGTVTWDNGLAAGTTATISPITGTNYTATCTTASGCKGTVVSTVTVNPKPTVVIIGSEFCEGKTGTITASGATTYSWSGASPFVTTASNPAVVSQSGTYTVIGTLNGCTATATTTVTVNAIPTFDLTAFEATCTAGSANINAKLSISGLNLANKFDYSEGISYTGTKTFASASDITAATTTVTLANPTADKSYTVRVFNAKGCNTDKTIILRTKVCECKPDVCLPYSYEKIK